MKKLLVVLAVLFFSQHNFCQTLFSYGTKTVSKDEFLNAFNKTPNPDSNRAAALKEYVGLYINFKLKVQAAYDEKLNETGDYKMESDNFKSRLAENAIDAQADISQLIHEAFVRSQKDIHLSQVFIAANANVDTTVVYQQINKAYTDLQSGKNFDDVVAAYGDPGTRKSNGDLGYVTVFTLPYEIENIVYALPVGGISKSYRSSIGYHIFKNDGERKAVGKRVISQILFAVAPDANETGKRIIAQKADSVYNLIQKGADFETERLTFSNVPNAQNSKSFEVAIGQYGSGFENEVFALKNTGDISKPFETPYGYNILKLVEIKKINTDSNDVEAKAELQQSIEKDGRLDKAKKNLINKWFIVTQYKPAAYNTNDLWEFTDSAIKNKDIKSNKSINMQTVLFSFTKQNFTANDWVEFVKAERASKDKLGRKPYPDMMKEYVNMSCGSYYRAHLDEYDNSLRKQLKEFNEANLLFAAMDKNVWGKAGSDSAGLQQYYNAHLSKYMWAPSVNAIVINADTKEHAEYAATKIKANPEQWRSIVNAYGASVSADSSRFEQGQLPIREHGPFDKGFTSQPEKTGNDSYYTFIYVIEVYPQPTQRSFADARGMVINDYQQLVEDKWIASLKERYPVKINEAVLKSIQ
jgi:peptidyl-prolyl cis-trans isomerase SurA